MDGAWLLSLAFLLSDSRLMQRDKSDQPQESVAEDLKDVESVGASGFAFHHRVSAKARC